MLQGYRKMIRALFLGRVMGGSFPIVNLIFYFSTISMIYLYFKKTKHNFYCY